MNPEENKDFNSKKNNVPNINESDKSESETDAFDQTQPQNALPVEFQNLIPEEQHQQIAIPEIEDEQTQESNSPNIVDFEAEFLQYQLNSLMLQNLQEYQRMLQLFLNENYLVDLKREFLKFKIFFFHENNQDHTELTDNYLNEQFALFREDIMIGLNKTFEAFDEQEINFKIDRLYKWNRIVQSSEIDFYIFYREDKLQEKENKIQDNNFCYSLIHPTPMKELLPSYSCLFDKNDLPKTEERNEKIEECEHQMQTKSESETKFGEKEIETNYSLNFKKNDEIPISETLPFEIRSEETPESLEELASLPTIDPELVSNELSTGIRKYVSEPSFKIDTNKGFDEFFNVNTNVMHVAEEYQHLFAKIISKGEYLSFPINNEFIMLLKPRFQSSQTIAKLLRYPLLVKSCILPYLSTSDFLTLRMANKSCQDIIKSVWHNIYKQEISEQVMMARILKYVF